MQPTLAFAPVAEDFAAAYFDMPATLMLGDFNNLSFLSPPDEDELDETEDGDLDGSEDESDEEDEGEEDLDEDIEDEDDALRQEEDA